MKMALLLLVLMPMLGVAAPNVLFLFADDMRADSIGALGNPVVKTPNLDRLVRRGVSFTNAYCMGGNSPAVCTPSRNMLLSGQAFFRWKDHRSPLLPPGRPAGLLCPGEGLNVPASFQQAGYQTYHHGKKGNTALEIQARFEINKYLQDDLADRVDGEPGRQIADEAIAFLTQRQDSRPFFMYLAFGNPHDPRVAAEKYLGLYSRDQIPLPKNFLPQHPFDNGEMTIRDEKLSPWPRTEAEIRRHLHEYYAVISGLDHHIGRVLAALEAAGQLDNTLILFSADQGVAIGSHGLLGKQNLYEDGMKVPLIFAGPGIAPGRSDALVYLLDLYPTLCELTGATPAAGIDGRSFAGILQGRAKAAREDLFFAYRDVQRALRTDRYKLIRYPQIHRTQLFDLSVDPEETHDLAADPAQAALIADLTARLEARQRQFGDDLPLSAPEPKPAAWSPPTAD
jgi:arylsulfatase A-like enzyme